MRSTQERAARRSWRFNTRWWAGVATVFLLGGPLALEFSLLMRLFNDPNYGLQPQPRLEMESVIALAMPLLLGAGIASAREIHLPEEPPLHGFRRLRRWASIVLGFALPFVMAYNFWR